MHVFNQTHPAPTALPGIDHATWAGTDEGLSQLSLWRQNLAPGAATPPHGHDCDEVVLCLSGTGEVNIDGQSTRFGAACTVVLPRGRTHQIVNVGPEPLEILGIFAGTPVGTHLPDGQEIALPWRS